jgi:hypothetical protein
MRRVAKEGGRVQAWHVASLPPLVEWGIAIMALVAATILLPAAIVAAIQIRNGWKTEKIDRGHFIEIGPLF